MSEFTESRSIADGLDDIGYELKWIRKNFEEINIHVSLHDHLAALAMQGNLSCAGDKMRAVKLGTPKDLREFAVLNHDIADAMMAERERRVKDGGNTG